jgi:hypothetical protein
MPPKPQQKQADELRTKSLLNKYTKKAQANFKAKKAQQPAVQWSPMVS